ncbi:MAG: hypothetical protein IJS09_04540 [Treponema sp.]|nr:hypothetical protein [Treponema sp.]
MVHYAILCGSAPEGFRQKKLIALHDFLTSKEGGLLPERNIIIFPSGVHELMLECTLNNALDEAAEEDDGEVLLYFCTQTDADLHAELSDSSIEGVEVVRLGKDEIRKDVIAYYAEKLAGMLEVNCRVMYEADGELVSEESFGYERIG